MAYIDSSHLSKAASGAPRKRRDTMGAGALGDAGIAGLRPTGTEPASTATPIRRPAPTQARNGRREPEPPDEHFPPEPKPEPEPARYLFAPGGSFILDTDPEPKALWGQDDQVLQAEGESLLIAGPQGTGKTTIIQQYALGRGGFAEYDTLLGFPIIPGQRRVLYLAMDRPRQVARSFRRMVGEAWRNELDARLSVWQGPPPHDLAKHPSLLLKLCNDANADTVIVDSLKDAALGLSEDEVGAAYNRARQTTLAGGIQVAELHHLRKALSGAQAEHPTLDDVYGSTWLTAGTGSVLLLNGKPGDPIVKLHHLKQPAAEVGPFSLIHNRDTGRTTIHQSADILGLAKALQGITVTDAAKALYEVEEPDRNHKEKARHKLNKLTADGFLVVVDPGDQKANKPMIWGPA